MKQETLIITQTFRASSEAIRKSTLQKKVEHYLKAQLRNEPKPI